MNRSQGSIHRHGGCGSSPLLVPTRRGGGCQSRTPFPRGLDNSPAHFGAACNAESSKNPALGMVAALKTPSCPLAKQRLGLCQPHSAGPAAVCVYVDSLPSPWYIRSLLGTPTYINKVACTNTPCLSSSLPPALTLSKYDCYVPARVPCALTSPFQSLPSSQALHCNQNESQEAVLQLMRNEMS